MIILICPKCGGKDTTFDTINGKVYCDKCGYVYSDEELVETYRIKRKKDLEFIKSLSAPTSSS